MAWKKPEEETPSVTPSAGAASPSSGAAGRPADAMRASNGAVIGSSLVIKGEVTGNEDLFIHGQIDGKVTLNKNSVVVGREGRVKADIYARSIRVEGQVNGDLYGEGEVIIHKSGQVRGNITAPQVSLENGSKFKGAIDMEPGDERGASDSKPDGKSKEVSAAGGSAQSSPSPAPASVTSGAGKEAATASSRS